MDADDRQQILDLISAYSYGYDESDFDLLESVFAEESKLGPFAGTSAEVRSRMQDRRTSLAGQGIQTRHYQTNTMLTEVEDGVIQGRTMLLVFWQKDGTEAPTPMHTGVYVDEFRRTSAGWRIASRDIQIDHD